MWGKNEGHFTVRTKICDWEREKTRCEAYYEEYSIISNCCVNTRQYKNVNVITIMFLMSGDLTGLCLYMSPISHIKIFFLFCCPQYKLNYGHFCFRVSTIGSRQKWLNERLTFLFNNTILSDVIFVVGQANQQHRIPAHRFVLSGKSFVNNLLFQYWILKIQIYVGRVKWTSPFYPSSTF